MATEARDRAGGPATLGRVGPPLAVTGAGAVDRFARWLLLAVALDLVLTRLVVRLAIFVPKGEPLASVAAVLGRVGAATDALVPIMGALLLGALLLRAGHDGGRPERVLALAVTVVAVGGLGLVVLPPTPSIVVVLEAIVMAVAVAAGSRVLRSAPADPLLRVGIVSLIGAIVLASLGRIADVGVLGEAPSGLALGALGQVAYVAGAALVGLAGVIGAIRTRAPLRRPLVLGCGAALVVLAMGVGSPATWGALAIWSIGLAGLVPPIAIAIAVGLAVAGLPALHRRAPTLAVGLSIVLLAGYGPVGSGLVFAALLGLLLPRGEPVAGRGPRGALVPHTA